ncbi:hypothetical protein [Rubritalea tangerina]|uniref:hypothetical protein n=1 Tax=Rubritalea tangerina TaxID=430798 RepID=UPI0036178A05
MLYPIELRVLLKHVVLRCGRRKPQYPTSVKETLHFFCKHILIIQHKLLDENQLEQMKKITLSPATCNNH